MCFYCATTIYVKRYGIIVYRSRFGKYLFIIQRKFSRKCIYPRIGILCVVCRQCDCCKLFSSVFNREFNSFFRAVRSRNLCRVGRNFPSGFHRNIASYRCVVGDCATIFKRPTKEGVAKQRRGIICKTACRRTIRNLYRINSRTAICIKGYGVVVHSSHFRKYLRIIQIKLRRKGHQPRIGILFIISRQRDCRKFIFSIFNREFNSFFRAVCSRNLCRVGRNFPSGFHRNIASYRCVVGNYTVIFKSPANKGITSLCGGNIRKRACRRTIIYFYSFNRFTAVCVKRNRILTSRSGICSRIGYIFSYGHKVAIPTLEFISILCRCILRRRFFIGRRFAVIYFLRSQYGTIFIHKRYRVFGVASCRTYFFDFSIRLYQIAIFHNAFFCISRKRYVFSICNFPNEKLCIRPLNAKDILRIFRYAARSKCIIILIRFSNIICINRITSKVVTYFIYKRKILNCRNQKHFAIIIRYLVNSFT